MCGIAGEVSRDRRPAGSAELRRAVRALAHRGPDEEGLWTSPSGVALLGHRRLAVIDVAHGHQPLASEDGSVQVVLNGEIYNFRELRAELERRGHRFRTAADGECVAHLYEEHGAECVVRLRGMFALALWDERRRRLLLARDRLGKKPLLWGERGGRFVFASELNALRAGWGKGDLDPVALDAYLALGSVPAPLTIESCYRKLPPASTLVLESGRPPAVEAYWRLSALPKLRIGHTAAVEAVRAKLEESVRLRLVSEVPLGLFLSGGVDSSAVLATMARVGVGSIQTFTVGFEDPRFDESAPARAAARAAGAVHHTLTVKPDSVELLERVLLQYGEPFADSSCLPTYVLAGLARERVTVALTGDGGDELFAGYPRYPWLLALSRAARLVPPGIARRLAASLPRAGRLRAVGRACELLASDDAGRAFELVSIFGTEQRRLLLHEPLPGPGPGAAHVRRAFLAADGALLDRFLGAEVRTYLCDDLLTKMDIATMAHGLEARSPLLDHELVELVFRLPAELKRGRRSKALLKDAVASFYPAGFLERPKRGLGLPLSRWIRGDLAGFFQSELKHGALARSGLVRMPYVEQLLAEERAGLAPHRHRLFALVSLSLFLGARGA